MELSDLQMKTLLAMMDRLIPANEFASASQAGVQHYIIRQLAGDMRDWAAKIRDGFDGLNVEAREAFGGDFAALAAEQQDELLRRVERGDTKQASGPAMKKFFSIMVPLCAEGYYADPGNGGNRDAVSWNMIGYMPDGVRKPNQEKAQR